MNKKQLLEEQKPTNKVVVKQKHYSRTMVRTIIIIICALILAISLTAFALSTALKKKVQTFEITYNLNSGINGENPEKYNVGDSPITLKEPTKTGYTFLGWFDNNEFTGEAITSLNTNLSGGFTLYAKWELASYSITYNLNGGTNGANPTSYTVEDEDIILADANRDNYTFDGWFDNSEFNGEAITTLDTSVAKDYTLYAKWEATVYTATFVDDQGERNVKFTIEDKDEFPAPEVRQKTGYTGAWENYSVTLSNFTVNAVYTQNNYSIIYNLNGGTNGANPTKYTYGTPAITLQNPTKTGYNFLGWFDNSEFNGEAITTLDTSIAGGYTLYAKFTPISYSITYNLSGGTNGANPTSYTVETPTITLQKATKDYYTFDGWFNNSECTGEAITTLDTSIAGGYTLYAKFTPISYTITYNLNGGTNGANNPENYTYGNSFNFNEPTKANYDFMGWFTEETFENKITGVTSTTNGNLELYAKWETAVGLLFTYIFDENNKAHITGYIGEDPNVVIPAQIKDSNDGIKKDVEFIDSNAFANKTIIESVTIPASVTTIGDYAFANCSNLTNITIPNSVTNIKYYAFQSCSNLTNITIPDSVITIGEGAFNYCSGLTSITIPASVTSIGEYAFSGCSGLQSVSFENGSNCQSIGDNAFVNCGGFTSITIPASVTSIGDYAFGLNTHMASNLQTVTFEENSNCQSIGANAFNWCFDLINITFPKSLTTLQTLGYYGIGSSVQTITFQEGIEITSIPNDFANGRSTLQSVTIPASVTLIGDNAFYGCGGLTTITIPANVISIGETAFQDCSNLAEVINYSEFLIIEKGATTNGYVGYYATNVVNNYQVHYALEDDEIIAVKYVGTDSNITLRNDCTQIEANAFSGCLNIQSVTIPASVKSIGSSAFGECENLHTVTFETESQLQTIGDWAFCACNITSITIPASVTTIEEYAFIDCIKLMEVINYSETLTIEKGADTNGFVGYYALVVVNRDNSYTTRIVTENSVQYYVEGTDVIAVNYVGTDSNVTLRADVTSVGNGAFVGCGLTSITIPTDVTSIGAGAFYECSNLTQVIFAANSQLTTIGESAFCECGNLTNIIIPTSVESIGDEAFGYSALTTVYYLGTESEWDAITKGTDSDSTLTNATKYYYSETNTGAGNIWHYVDGVPTIWS
ncbi:MAG: leucine-rich repeat protein [Clostridia bacterium]|nr:leucine-rich repeat protein [Clostridia bacterium]